MPIPFNCPQCGKQTLVADVFAGQTGPCSGCGAEVSVPQIVGNSKKPLSAMYVLLPLGVALLMATFLLMGVLAAFVVPARQNAIRSARAAAVATAAAQNNGNLRQIGVALHNYHDVHGSFPPAYLADGDGRRSTSGRALILPYVDSQSIANQYDTSSPWNAKVNRPLVNMGPSVFRSDFGEPNSAVETSFVLITGPGTAFEGDKAVKVADMPNGISNVAIAVEVRSSGVMWSEPRDLPIDELGDLLQSGKLLGQNGMVSVLMADGSVREIHINQASAQLRAMAMTGRPVEQL